MGLGADAFIKNKHKIGSFPVNDFYRRDTGSKGDRLVCNVEEGDKNFSTNEQFLYKKINRKHLLHDFARIWYHNAFITQWGERLV